MLLCLHGCLNTGATFILIIAPYATSTKQKQCGPPEKELPFLPKTQCCAFVTARLEPTLSAISSVFLCNGILCCTVTPFVSLHQLEIQRTFAQTGKLIKQRNVGRHFSPGA